MEFQFQCQYCGKRWTQSFYYEGTHEYLRCSVCNDNNIKVKKEKIDTDVFGYNKDKKNVSKTK